MNLTRWCGGCAAETAFDRFDCLDHPEECVELVCVLCGEGFELAPVQGSPGAVARPGRRLRPRGDRVA